MSDEVKVRESIVSFGTSQDTIKRAVVSAAAMPLSYTQADRILLFTDIIVAKTLSFKLDDKDSSLHFRVHILESMNRLNVGGDH